MSPQSLPLEPADSGGWARAGEGGAGAEEARYPWRLIERAIAYTTLWGTLGAAVPLSLYAAEAWPWLAPGEHGRWLVQVVTFLVSTMAVCCAAIATGVCVVRRLRAPRALEIPAAALFGAAAGSLFGAIGVSHFGSLALPYVGGPLLVATSITAMIVVAGAYARAERPQPSWRQVLIAALIPLLPVALGLGAIAWLAPEVSLELDAMRQLAAQLGLATLGAMAGAAVGGIGGLWLATAARLARRRL